MCLLGRGARESVSDSELGATRDGTWEVGSSVEGHGGGRGRDRRPVAAWRVRRSAVGAKTGASARRWLCRVWGPRGHRKFGHVHGVESTRSSWLRVFSTRGDRALLLSRRGWSRLQPYRDFSFSRRRCAASRRWHGHSEGRSPNPWRRQSTTTCLCARGPRRAARLQPLTARSALGGRALTCLLPDTGDWWRLRRLGLLEAGGEAGQKGCRVRLRPAIAGRDHLGPRRHLRERGMHPEEADAPGVAARRGHEGLGAVRVGGVAREGHAQLGDDGRQRAGARQVAQLRVRAQPAPFARAPASVVPARGARAAVGC